jgi:hypothetical protein
MYKHGDHVSNTAVWEGNYSTAYNYVVQTSYRKNGVHDASLNTETHYSATIGNEGLG